MKKYLLLMFLILVLSYSSLFSCTVFYYANGKIVLGGNSEDWSDPFSRIWFLPAEEKSHGRVYFGFREGGYMGGMNDQGLFFDGLATDVLKVTLSANKETYQGDLIDKVMSECSSVDEVLAVFDKYNLQFMERVMFFFGDKKGNSAIIEGDVVIRKKGNFQICTNFYQSQFEPGSITDRRYKRAEKIFKDNDDITLDVFRKIFAATHQEGQYPTQYSNIYDLKNGLIYIYHFHNYENVVVLNLSEELEKGKHTYDLASLFPETFAAEAYKQPIQDDIEKRKAERQIANIDQKTYDLYVGEYEIDPAVLPGYTVTVDKEDDKLYMQMQFLDRTEIFPESETQFFFVGIDEVVEIQFTKNETESTPRMVIKMFGMEMPAEKIKQH
ncbi:DUF3471 domain-containing protein [Acidobacteriota bacterium]